MSDNLREIKHIYTAQLGVVGALPLRLLLTDNGSDTSAPSWLGDRFQVTRMPGLINVGLLGERSPANRPERSLLATATAGVARLEVSLAAANVALSALQDEQHHHEKVLVAHEAQLTRVVEAGQTNQFEFNIKGKQ